LTAVSAFGRRESEHCRRRLTEKIATSAITRLYAEKGHGNALLVSRSRQNRHVQEFLDEKG
jgi:hypothetical protein